MPRSRGAAATRSEPRRKRGEHDNKTAKRSADERRARDHATAEATTDSLQLFINSAMKYPPLTGPEEIELAKRIEKGDLAAKEKLINSNLRLVIKFARRYQGPRARPQGHRPGGDARAIRAAEKFDWRRGYKFSTYAVLWIKQSIQRGLDNSGRAVRIPAHIAQRERTVNRITAELTTKFDHEPTDEEVAKAAELPLDEVMATRDLTRVTTSLDTPVGDGDTTFGELHAEETAPLEDEVLEREQELAVDAALAKLPEKERRIIKARFGTGGRPERALREAAREVGVTQEQARRLEERALARLSTDGLLDAWRDAA